MALARLTKLVPNLSLGSEMVLGSLDQMESDLGSVSAARLVIPMVMASVLVLQKLLDLAMRKLMVSKNLAQENFRPPMLELFLQREMRP
jgi:hypothetical protein